MPDKEKKGDWRQAPSRRPSAFGGDRNDREIQRPPTMSRSRAQLATAYAPGVLMTWEGGKGICRTVPLENELTALKGSVTEAQIFEHIKEFVENWRDRALNSVDAPVDELILDAPFRNRRTGDAEVERPRFQLTGPEKMGYVPYPQVYRCGTCGSVREYSSIADQARRPLPIKCNGHPARWTQVDVVYVHWSGELQPLSPYNFNYDASSQEVIQFNRCTCGSQSFKLKNDAPTFAEWRYVCEGCGESRQLKKAARDALGILERERETRGRDFHFVEANMLPVSYRANSAFYPQRGNFIEFADRQVIDLMSVARTADLLARLSEIHDIPFTEPDTDEIRAAVEASDEHRDEWEDYESLLSLARRNDAKGKAEMAKKWQAEAREMREGWFASGLIERGNLESPAIRGAVRTRGEWARRYDPIRLTVQHDAFVAEHVVAAMQEHNAVDVLKPDLTLTDTAGDPVRHERYIQDTSALMEKLGLEKLILLRGLPVCDFSFGYSRVSSGPVYTRELNGAKTPMPVRLMAFDPLPVDGSKRPIYVTRQKNEALYFKLDEQRVRDWLRTNDVPDVPDDHLGRAYLEQYEDFGQFLEGFKDREGRQGGTRTLPAYIYLLLHTLSHQFMHALADTSGVDRDGIGEHIFPADLAFTIYRKGMTPDLGNISAMWRNASRAFLKRAIDPRQLRCGSGALCDVRGGACPACVMVAEVSCTASNLLLSRAALQGGTPPNWENRTAPNLVGFFAGHGN